MFSLIITIMSISLVAVLAAASFFYGGSAYTDSAKQSRANQIMNEAEQLSSANTLYRTQSLEPVNTIDELVASGFLNSWQGEQWGIGDGYIEVPAAADEMGACEMINQKSLGTTDIPACSSIDTTTVKTVCCTR